MRRTKVAVFIHVIWGTWDRLPLLTDEVVRDVYRGIRAKCLELGATIVALGGVDDHIHLVIELPATVSLADVVEQANGASAHLATHQLAPGQFFKWQGSYAAYSVSPNAVPRVADYIARQREHHAAGSTIPEWEYAPVGETPPAATR